jgi:hypothetical protein
MASFQEGSNSPLRDVAARILVRGALYALCRTLTRAAIHSMMWSANCSAV